MTPRRSVHDIAMWADQIRYIILVFVRIVLVLAKWLATEAVKLGPDTFVFLLGNRYPLPHRAPLLPKRLGVTFLDGSRRHFALGGVGMAMRMSGLRIWLLALAARVLIRQKLP